MPEYKKQHYLPACYLKYFSIDQGNCSRDSWIWRFDGKVPHQVPVVSQCSGDYHYSRERAAETEAMFGRMEAEYCRCVDRIKADRRLTEKEYGNLLLFMFDLNLRNNVHKNSTGKEGIAAYHIRSHTFLHQVLLCRKSGDSLKSDIIEHLRCFWTLRILTPQMVALLSPPTIRRYGPHSTGLRAHWI